MAIALLITASSIVLAQQPSCGEWLYQDGDGKIFLNLPPGDFATGTARRKPSCAYWGGGLAHATRTKVQIMSKLNLNSTQIAINTSDASFYTDARGGHLDCPFSWGMAVGCEFDIDASMVINLTGTPFAVQLREKAWNHHGAGSEGSVTCNPTGKMCTGKCGGGCGGCLMDNANLTVVDRQDFECGVKKIINAKYACQGTTNPSCKPVDFGGIPLEACEKECVAQTYICNTGTRQCMYSNAGGIPYNECMAGCL
eukprot:m.347923 g.347923  ORF g.347923 m.347923 type:complete len:254 (+) comp34900_c0_seq1:209-970(+)